MSVKKIAIFLLFMFCANAYAESNNVVDALRATYENCIGIDESLNDIKKMAGINTAIGAVGTGMGVGATAVGIAKKKVDAEAEKIEIKLDNLRKVSGENYPTHAQDFSGIDANMKSGYNDDALDALINKYADANTNSQDVQDLKTLEAKSKKLGNWRTGLMAGTTVTGVAGAVVSAENRVDNSLENQVNQCADSVEQLRRAVAVARIDGQEIFDAQNIIDACDGFQYVDLSGINRRGRGATVSAVAAATTGLTGTVLSAIANSQKIRDDNTSTGRTKEKGLNTSSNIFAAGTSVASAVSTVFSASQIAAIKKVVEISGKCNAALKAEK